MTEPAPVQPVPSITFKPPQGMDEGFAFDALFQSLATGETKKDMQKAKASYEHLLQAMDEWKAAKADLAASKARYDALTGSGSGQPSFWQMLAGKGLGMFENISSRLKEVVNMSRAQHRLLEAAEKKIFAEAKTLKDVVTSVGISSEDLIEQLFRDLPDGVIKNALVYSGNVSLDEIEREMMDDVTRLADASNPPESGGGSTALRRPVDKTAFV